jgi:hypothetical protein
MNILFLIGYVLALNKLAIIVYKMKVLGFKYCFHEITEFVGIEKKLFHKINSFFFILCSELSPIILFSYPLLMKWWGSWIVPDDLMIHFTSLRTIAFILYIAALITGFFYLLFFLRVMWKYGKGKINFTSSQGE